jgi:hypothetical protein
MVIAFVQACAGMGKVYRGIKVVPAYSHVSCSVVEVAAQVALHMDKATAAIRVERPAEGVVKVVQLPATTFVPAHEIQCC